MRRVQKIDQYIWFSDEYAEGAPYAENVNGYDPSWENDLIKRSQF